MFTIVTGISFHTYLSPTTITFTDQDTRILLTTSANHRLLDDNLIYSYIIIYWRLRGKKHFSATPVYYDIPSNTKREAIAKEVQFGTLTVPRPAGHENLG